MDQPSNPQIALAKGATGFLEGLLGRKQQQEAQDLKMKYLESQNAPVSDYRQQLLDLRRRELESKTGGGDGGYEFGKIFGLDPSDPRYHIQVPAKSAPSIAAQSFSASKPTAGEQKATSDAAQMSALGSELGKQWKEMGFGAGTAGQGALGKVAQYVPGQISQRVAPEKYTQFDNTKKILSETALRISTGAATNPSEVAVYKSMLPEPGDSPSIARNKINNFFTRAGVKGEDTARRMEAQGLVREAKRHREQTVQRLQELKAQMLMDFGGEEGAPATEAAPPAGGGSPTARHLSRIDSLK